MDETKKTSMLIAVSAEGDEGLDATVAAHFGRCAFYVLVNVKDGQVASANAVANPFYEHHGQPGEVPRFIKEQGTDVMLAGGMGGGAVQFFDELGVQAVTGASGTVAQAVGSYLDGTLTGTQPCGH